MAALTNPARAGSTVSPTTVIIVAGCILSLSMGLRQCMGLFLPPIRADIGISASQFGLAMALQNIVWGMGQPFIGMLGDKYGARPVLIVSALLYAAGLLIMAGAHSAFGINFGGGLVAGLGLAGTGFGVLIGSVSRAVPAERRTQTVGLVSAAGSLGTLALAPLGQALITNYGWRAALIAFVAVAASMAAIAVAIGKEAPQPVPAAGEDARSMAEILRRAAGHPGYLAMSVAFFACGFQLMFITAYLPQYLAICGVSPATSASALGLIGLGNAIGSYVFGRLGARHSPKRLLSAIYLLRTAVIAAFLLAPVSPTSVYAFAACMGLLWLGVVPLVSGLIGGMFGMRYFNTLFGLVFLSHQIGSFMGAWLGGLTFDLTGSFHTAWSAMIVIGLCAATLQWFMDDRAEPAEGFLREQAA